MGNFYIVEAGGNGFAACKMTMFSADYGKLPPPSFQLAADLQKQEF